MVVAAKRDEGGVVAARTRKRRRPTATCVVNLAAVLALSGCSSVPDALNPVEWYEGTTDTVGGWFSDEEPQTEAAADSSVDGKDFPNLASVPERPTPSTTADERAKIQQGLVADRNNARYTDSADASAPADPPKPRGATQTASAPAAAPPLPSTKPAPKPAPAASSTPPAPAASAPAASRPTVSDPTPEPTRAKAPPPAPTVASSGDRSSLWPHRPVPQRESGTPLTTGKVSDSHSAIVLSDEPLASSVSPQPRPRTSTPASASGTRLDSAGNASAPVRSSAASSAPKTKTDGPEVTRRLISTTRTTKMTDGTVRTETDVRDPAVASATSAPATSSAAAPALPSSSTVSDSAADQSPSVIVDSPSLDQYQLGFSGPAYLVGTVNFAHGSSSLNADDRDMVRSIASAARETDAYIRVIGHASSRTAEMALPEHELVNFQESLARAEAVGEALISAGIPRERVLVEAMSASQPLYFESMPSGEAGNRRAEILFQY